MKTSIEVTFEKLRELILEGESLEPPKSKAEIELRALEDAERVKRMTLIALGVGEFVLEKLESISDSLEILAGRRKSDD